jgi:hypothetical protein
LPSDLRGLQERFLALVTSPEGVSGTDLAGLVVGDARLDQVGRLTIYADMYLERLIDVLLEDFPKLASALGEDPFRGLVRDFLAACPPSGFSLRHLGGPLPAYLATHAAGAERPWLVELAHLEWARADVFDGPDRPVISLDDLRRLPPERFAELPLQLVPTHRLLPVGFAVEEVWRRIDRGDPAGTPDPSPGLLLVWRKQTDVLHRRPDPQEVELLADLAAGTTFGQVCERLGAGRSVEEAAGVALTNLVGWADQGLLARPANELK